MIPFPEPDWKILGRGGGWEKVQGTGGRTDEGSEDGMGFCGKEDLIGRTDEVLGVSDVDRLRDVWEVTEDDEMV